MLAIRLVVDPAMPGTLVLPVGTDADPPVPAVTALRAPDDAFAEAGALARATERPGAPGAVQALPRPLRTPSRLLLVGIGAGDEAGWRAAGAALAGCRGGETSITIAMPADAPAEAVRGLAEGLWLASYRYRMPGVEPDPIDGGEVLVAVSDTAPYEVALADARATARATRLARDLTNTPSSLKSPAWFADRVSAAAAEHPGLTVGVREPAQLAAEGFGGILAVGGGSAHGPRLVELAWRPEGATDATPHVVLVGKGITFDTGGISIKPRDAMKLMRKDMGGAAAVVAATIGAAALRLPVRVTALAPLAENMVSGSAFRPGDVIRHYTGVTSETTNSDAEGRLVLADALGYAVQRLAPDLLIDLATLTGANAVALGKRTAALYSDNDELARAVLAAGAAAGESAWRMPLPADYVEYLGSELADLYSAPDRGAGSVTAALYLREFTGELRDRWVHVDMSAPSWADGNDGELTRGATGWGVRTLLRWLPTLVPPATS
ncbi:leucyl aminopeptidase [Micromonospora pattaloongensis]|uniref:Probable cytosol aminopeptidase n=1 Tax=Micromonospora pattaloongensis TaxID=405436 RepID=A0A1H3GQC3_9ACTN|nr:leucyl aminopeptidase family protein [Micromonospora pattaloongensis]SDY05526.1 leucyl aminopeptidase [Micromonospora pattaloongensis]